MSEESASNKKGELSFDDISPFPFDFDIFIKIIIRMRNTANFLWLLLFADEIVLNMIMRHIMKKYNNNKTMFCNNILL